MTRTEVTKAMQSTGDAKRAYTRVIGKRQRVIILNWSVDGKHVIVRTPAGNDVYRTPRQLSQADSDVRPLQVQSVEPGQTIDLNDVVITTTLYRLG